MIVNFSTSRELNGFTVADDYTIALSPKTVAVSAPTATIELVKDVNYDKQSFSQSANINDIAVTNSLENPTVTYESLTPTVCTVNAAGIVGHISTGTCTIETVGRSGRKRPSFVSTLSGASSTYTQRVGEEVPGSLRRYLYDQMVATLLGVTPGEAAQKAGVGVVTAIGDSSSVNTACFIRTVNKAGVPNLDLNLLDGVLDSPYGSSAWRAWISPYHYLAWPGHKNTDFTGATSAYRSEIGVGLSATPWAGALAKILPNDVHSAKMPTLVGSPGNKGYLAWVRRKNVYNPTANGRWVTPLLVDAQVNQTPSNIQQYERDDNVDAFNGGDSGSPVFININGTLVMLGHVVGGVGMAAWDYRGHEADINEMMAALPAPGAPYTVGVVDLGGFPSY